MGAVLQDVRYALRTLAKSRSFAVVAVVTLGLGIGANSAIFSVVNAVLLRPLPFPESDRLVRIYNGSPSLAIQRGTFTPPDYQDLASGTHVFSGLASFWYWPGQSGTNLTGDGEPLRLETAYVSGTFFGVLGARAAHGRVIRPKEDTDGADQVVVLSDAIWRRRFGADPGIVGRTVTLSQGVFTVVGIMPPSFIYPSRQVDVWVPVSLIHDDDIPHRRGIRWLGVIGRLAPGNTVATASVAANTVMRRLAASYPETNRDWNTALVLPLRETIVGDIRPALLVLLGAVALVLLIACANLANLLLARGTARGRDLAVRTALGAGRKRLIRQSLTESLVLAALGGALGLGISVYGTDLLVRLGATHLPQPDAVHTDGQVVLFTLLVTIATGLLFGIIPALRMTGLEVSQVLREGGRTGTEAGRRDARGIIVVVETALAVVLLVGAGLMVRSLWRLTNVDPGFQPDNVLTFSLSVPAQQSGGIATYYQQLLDRLRDLPGVTAVGGSKTLPLQGGGEPYGIGLPDRPHEQITPQAGALIITPGYFAALGIPLRGREFTYRDQPPPATRRDADQTMGVVIVNRALARTYFPGTDPVGKRITMGGSWFQIVGVAGDVHNDGLTEASAPALYVPETLFQRSTMKVFVRTSANPQAVAPAVRQAVWDFSPTQTIADMTTMRRVVADEVAQPQLIAVLLGSFAALALGLALLGIYGVISYGVVQRTRELGIRMALGARRRTLLGMVLGQTLTLTALGLAVGLIGALLLSRVLASLLFEISSSDPLTLVLAGSMLLATGIVAGLIPALRATRVDPMVALRHE